jgi:hypothetical protein
LQHQTFCAKICKHLLDNGSNIVVASAGWQSVNGPVELFWAYLTEKQKPSSFWFYLVVHLAGMMNNPRKIWWQAGFSVSLG